MHNPSESHMDVVLKNFRYLKSAPRRGVMFSKHDKILDVCSITNADWDENIRIEGRHQGTLPVLE